MTGRLAGRRLLVTGAASGMGKAIATLFITEGAAVALLDRDEVLLAEVAAALGAFHAICDVAEARSVDQAVAAAVTSLGGLDGVVNAAGILVTRPFAEFDRETWDQLISVNLTGPFNIIHSALPALQAAPSATIVNIASVSGYMPMAGTTGYSASKAGLIMFTKSLAFDLGPGIRANCICPGVVRTEMTRYLWENSEHAHRAADRVALKRLGAPEDVARAALYLSSADSAFTTGTEILVDGGFCCR